MELKNHLLTRTGFEIIEETFDPQQIINTGSLFLIGNGYLGYRGTFLEWRRDKYVACTVSNTYDEAEGEWKELSNAPNGLFTVLYSEGEEVSIFQSQVEDYYRKLDLKSGLYQRTMSWKGKKGKRLVLTDERFASYSQIHLIPLSLTITPEDEMAIKLVTGIDGQIWDLHGTHLPKLKPIIEDGLLAMEGYTSKEGLKLVVVEGIKISSPPPEKVQIIEGDRQLVREYSFHLKAKEAIHIEKVMAVYSEHDTPSPLKEALQATKAALEKGYSHLLLEHEKRWQKIWKGCAIDLVGDLEAKTALNFNLYHQIIATPAHSQELPIGARGLSCQAYQGAAFWDQEIFNLPMFIYTQPQVARNILLFRYNTLKGARKKAKNLGYKGAFYPWMSDKDGEEICPSYFFTNLLTGRKIHNHFNDWQIHISPDIVYCIHEYYGATGDWEFMKNYGGEIAFEVARFLFSHAYFKKDKNRYEFIRVIGPDEYHENVDNNAFTNYQAHFSLKVALNIYKKLQEGEGDLLADLMDRIGLTEDEVKDWQQMLDLLYLPSPDPESLLIEQFHNYFQLEDISPSKLKERLKHPREYWGWPDGIAVETQVMKQADVVQLLALHDFSQEVMKANFDYYHQRTQHGSSLSPSVHALVATKIRDLEKALHYFYQSISIDLYNKEMGVVGGTFIGGIHTAACGGAWQMIVKGFAGMKVKNDILTFHPVLPPPWEKISFSLLFRGETIHFSLEKKQVKIKAEKGNKGEVPVIINDSSVQIPPGEEVIVSYSL